jgi:hypothetical protein
MKMEKRKMTNIVKATNVQQLRSLTTRGNMHDKEEEEMEINMRAWDDVTGMELDAKAVKRARNEELDYIRRIIHAAGQYKKDTRS